MNDIIDINGNKEKMAQYRSLQYENFQFLTKIFKEYLLEIEESGWKEIVKELENVLTRCDEIDYQSDATAVAYAIWHFLDRYHRVQVMCDYLLENGFLNRVKQYDVLDVGTGPSQVLFALSDHFQNLNIIEKQRLCRLNSDYVEQSQGFRNFLHHFVEYALGKEKQYLVPFHLGRTRNAFDIDFVEYSFSRKIFKYRYDLVFFNNFLTTKDFTEAYADTLRKICKYMRSNGLLIIIGATDRSEKYRDIYPMIDEIVNKPFNQKRFYGHWKKVCDREFNCTYIDEYGDILVSFFEDIVKYLKDNDLWEYVPERAKKEFEENMTILIPKETLKNRNGVTWKMVVYRKISRPNMKILVQNRFLPKNFVSLADDIWEK